MNFDEIFEAYYNLYRLEKDTPTTEDDEYPIAMRLANEAVNRWSTYDGTYWKELFTTLQQADDGEKTIDATVTEYAAPTDFKEAGGFLRLKDDNGNTRATFAILEPQEAQFRNDNGRFCYFTGNPGLGYTLHVNGLLPADTGTNMDYVYYKRPSTFTTGTDSTEMSDPYFCVHRMLANRFRGSRNPYYSTAKQDAEDVLKIMQMDNNSGSWANPWSLPDNSGTQWGA